MAHARLVITGAGGHRLHEEVIQAGGRISRGRFARYAVGQLREARAVATPDDAGPAVKAELVELWDTMGGPLFDAVEARGVSGPTVSSGFLPTGQRAMSTASLPFSPTSVPPFRRSLTSLRSTGSSLPSTSISTSATSSAAMSMPPAAPRRHPGRDHSRAGGYTAPLCQPGPAPASTQTGPPSWSQAAIPHAPCAAQGVAERTRPPRDGDPGQGTPPPCRHRPRRRRLGHHLDRMGTPRPA